MKQSGKVALGGILGGLSLVCMLLTVLPTTQLGLPALAGVILIPIVIEIGVRWGWMVYACVAILSLFITPSMEAKMMYIVFFGYYPVLKALIERLHVVWLAWLVKLALFNATMIGAYWVMLQFFALPADTLEIFGMNIPALILALGNVTFVLYDVALNGVVGTYMRVIHPKITRLFPH